MSSEYQFISKRHVKYLTRCLYLLPPGAASFDTSRMTVLFFALSGLDILGEIATVSDKDKKDIIEWIYSLQIISKDGSGGFRGGHCVTNILKSESNINDTTKSNDLDCSHITMTYSALASLIILGDDLSRVDKAACLRHVRSLQRKDGSFYSNAGGSENDLRFVYCAVVICHILGDMSTIDKESVVRYILNCLSYAGALGQGALQESHGGSTYCGVAALHLIGALPSDDTEIKGTESSYLSLKQREKLIRWLVMRQQNKDLDCSENDSNEDYVNTLGGGMQGRPNKPADSCYTFWVGASLKLLGCSHLIDHAALRQFVLSAQDPVVGGMGKHSSSHPDGLHTFLSISGLSLLDLGPSDNLLPVHPALNITHRALGHLEALGMSGRE